MQGYPGPVELPTSDSCIQRGVKAAEAESAVWEFVSDLLRDPEEIRRGMEILIEQERASRTRDPEHEAEVWAQKIAECDQRRGAYQDQQAAGLMTLEELGCKLRELDNTRRTAERELAALRTTDGAWRTLSRTGTPCSKTWPRWCPKPWTPSRARRKTGSTGCCGLKLRPPPRGTTSAALFVLLQPHQ